jgi:hypothetical protein
LKALLGYVEKCLTIQMYHVMMIITDGEIHDMSQTIDLIIELSKFPVSIIIVGVGEDDFVNMHKLDGDQERLRNSSRGVAERDIVQFVKMADYIDKAGVTNMFTLAEDVLKELPD